MNAKQLLLLSGALNVALAGTLLYQSLSVSEEPRVAKKTFAVSSGELIYSYFHCSFNELLEKLTDDRIVEEGYRVRDIALACLVSYHHFDLERALPTTRLQKRHLLFVHAAGGEEIDVPVFPGLTDDDFTAALLFARREAWPLTPKGLFLALKKSADPALIDTFTLTSEYLAFRTLLTRGAPGLSHEETLTLAKESSWEVFAKAAEERQFDPNAQYATLSALTSAGSKKAAELLHGLDRAPALKKIPEEPRPKKTIVEPSKMVYVVKKGDTLWQIARNHRVPLKKLLDANHLAENSALRPGKELLIP